MEQIRNTVRSRQPQDIYNELIVDKDVASALRDSRVVRNCKAATTRADKAARGHAPCSNFPDEVQVVLDLIKTDDFVRRITCRKNAFPVSYCTRIARSRT